MIRGYIKEDVTGSDEREREFSYSLMPRDHHAPSHKAAASRRHAVFGLPVQRQGGNARPIYISIAFSIGGGLSSSGFSSLSSVRACVRACASDRDIRFLPFTPINVRAAAKERSEGHCHKSSCYIHAVVVCLFTQAKKRRVHVTLHTHIVAPHC